MSARLVRAARRVVEAMSLESREDAIAELAAALPRKRGDRTIRKAERAARRGARDLAAFERLPLAKPEPTDRKAKRLTKGQARRATRPLCEARAGGCCEAAPFVASRCFGPLTWDHYWGRGKVPPNHEAEWMICVGHHDEKGAGDPSRRAWHFAFREHALRHGYFEQIEACDRGIALETAQHPGRIAG